MSLFYFETPDFHGGWNPRTSSMRPVIKRGRLITAAGISHRVRDGSLKKVPDHLLEADLETLQAELGQGADGSTGNKKRNKQ